jgi:hypothetical protein
MVDMVALQQANIGVSPRDSILVPVYGSSAPGILLGSRSSPMNIAYRQCLADPFFCFKHYFVVVNVNGAHDGSWCSDGEVYCSCS